MHLDVQIGDLPVGFECEDSMASAMVCRAILEGRTYPVVPVLDEVRVVLDVGANCGAAAVHFAVHHPEAVVHAFEPAAGPRAILERNAAAHPSIVVHPFGLHDHDADVALHHAADSIMGSIVRPSEVGTSEPVQVRRGDAWAREAGIDRVDVLKIDVEGVEVEALDGLGSLVDTAQVVYVEYDSRAARRAIDARLADTHELYFAAMIFLDQGEEIYLAKELCDRVDAPAALRELFAQLHDARAS